MIQDDFTAYSCCSIGIGRWYWALWANEEDARAGAEPVASGYEKTGEAAEKKAGEAAGSRLKRLAAKWASRYKRGGAALALKEEAARKPGSRRSRLARTPASANAPARPNFLFVASESEQAGSRGEVVIVRHRIVRQTPRKIYVDREPFREEEWQRQEKDGPTAEVPKPRTLTIDREALRREGRYTHHGSNFYASEEDGIRVVQEALTARHGWCAALGVRFPCSAESIKSAYRRLARENHPDAGGDPARFRDLERAYREAMAYLALPGEVTNPGRPRSSFRRVTGGSRRDSGSP
jgi:hypothetical protein